MAERIVLPDLKLKPTGVLATIHDVIPIRHGVAVVVRMGTLDHPEFYRETNNALVWAWVHLGQVLRGNGIDLHEFVDDLPKPLDRDDDDG